MQSALERAGIKPPASQEYAACTAETPFSSPALLRWYRDQTDRIISRTGIVDTALVLAQHGAFSGLLGLEEIGGDLSLPCLLIYDTSRPQTDDDDHTLSGWSKMNPSEVIRSYLSHSTPTTIVKADRISACGDERATSVGLPVTYRIRLLLITHS